MGIVWNEPLVWMAWVVITPLLFVLLADLAARRKEFQWHLKGVVVTVVLAVLGAILFPMFAASNAACRW